MKEQKVAVIFCAPQSLYPVPPKDVSKCELIDCTICNKPMWLSEKKKDWMKISKAAKMKIILECYICFEKRVKNDPGIMKDHVWIDI